MKLLLEVTSMAHAWLCLFLMILCGVLLIVGKVYQHKKNQKNMDNAYKTLNGRRGEISQLTNIELCNRHRELCRVLKDEDSPPGSQVFTLHEWMRKEMRRRGLLV